MEQQLSQILNEAKARINEAADTKACNEVRVKFFGKSSALTELKKSLKDVPAEERPQAGARINEVYDEIDKLLNKKQNDFKKQELDEKLLKEKVDVTLKIKKQEAGNLHPLTLGVMKFGEILTGMGFSEITGPEIEWDKYNFELLNIPASHPARDMQDTFYITDSILLRTQTSNTQPRAMETLKPPFKVFSAGRVFRRDEFDTTHSPSFYQVEGLYIDKNVNMADLKNTLTVILKKLLGEDTQIKFRASYFPFTEPSVEVDVVCNICKGKGCPSCKNAGCFELLGAGLVHPKVLEANGIDSKIYSGFAFGIGIERVIKSGFKIPDTRLLYENDIRFLKQFK